MSTSSIVGYAGEDIPAGAYVQIDPANGLIVKSKVLPARPRHDVAVRLMVVGPEESGVTPLEGHPAWPATPRLELTCSCQEEPLKTVAGPEIDPQDLAYFVTAHRELGRCEPDDGGWATEHLWLTDRDLVRRTLMLRLTAGGTSLWVTTHPSSLQNTLGEVEDLVAGLDIRVSRRNGGEEITYAGPRRGRLRFLTPSMVPMHKAEYIYLPAEWSTNPSEEVQAGLVSAARSLLDGGTIVWIHTLEGDARAELERRSS